MGSWDNLTAQCAYCSLEQSTQYKPRSGIYTLQCEEPDCGRLSFIDLKILIELKILQ